MGKQLFKENLLSFKTFTQIFGKNKQTNKKTHKNEMILPNERHRKHFFEENFNSFKKLKEIVGKKNKQTRKHATILNFMISYLNL